MKRLAACLLVLAACEKPNEPQQVEDDARLLAKAAQHELDDYAKRIDDILQRSRTIPPNIPGINDTGKLLGEANEKVIAMRGLFGPCAATPEQRDPKRWVQCTDRKTPLDKDLAQAQGPEAAAKVIEDRRAKLAEESTVINDRLTSVESWESVAELQLRTAPPVPPANATPPAPAP